MHATTLDMPAAVIRLEASDDARRADDISLVRRILAGDQAAFRELVERNQSRIFGVIYGILRKRQDAEEIAQEVFAKVYFSMGSFHHRGSLAAWIHRIAVNQCYAHLRKRRVSLVYEGDAAGDGTGIDLRSAADGRPTAERALAQRELVNHLLARMPEDDRALLLWKEVEGLSVSELAEMTGLKENTVKVRLFRARRRLAELAGRLSRPTRN